MPKKKNPQLSFLGSFVEVLSNVGYFWEVLSDILTVKGTTTCAVAMLLVNRESRVIAQIATLFVLSYSLFKSGSTRETVVNC